MIANNYSSFETSKTNKIIQEIINKYNVHIEGHVDTVSIITISNNREFIISGSLDCTVRIWNIAMKTQIKCLRLEHHPINSLAITSDNKFIIIGYNKGICIWDFKSLDNITAILLTNLSENITIFNNLYYFLSWTQDLTIKIWEIYTNTKIIEKKTLNYHKNEISYVAITSDNKFIISSSDNEIIAWDFEDNIIRYKITEEVPYAIKNFAISKDNKYIIYYTRLGDIKVWNLGEDRGKFIFSEYDALVTNTLLTIDCKYIMYCCSNNTLKIWNFNKHRNEFTEYEANIDCIAISYDNLYKAYALKNHIIKFSYILHRKDEIFFSGHILKVNCIIFYKNYKRLITASEDSTIRIWNLERNREKTILRGHANGIYCLDVTSDEKLLLSGGVDKTVRIWDIKLKKQLHIFKIFSSPVINIRVTYNIKHIVICSLAHAAKIYNFNGKNQVFSFTHVGGFRSIAFTRAEKYLLSGDFTGFLKVFKMPQKL